MTARSVTHAMFAIERIYPTSPSRVFKAFADPAAKALWFGGPPDWTSTETSMDFRVGGREVNAGGPPGGRSTASTAFTTTSSRTNGSSTPTRCTWTACASRSP